MSARPRIVLTGGPCGGKSALIADLLADPAWAGRVLAWPETVSFARIALAELVGDAGALQRHNTPPSVPD